MALSVLGDRIIVQQAESVATSKGGIVLPETSRMRPSCGHVTVVGPDVKMVGVGDEVYYGQYSGTEVEVDGTRHTVMSEGDVLLLIKKEIN